MFKFFRHATFRTSIFRSENEQSEENLKHKVDGYDGVYLVLATAIAVVSLSILTMVADRMMLGNNMATMLITIEQPINKTI